MPRPSGEAGAGPQLAIRRIGRPAGHAKLGVSALGPISVLGLSPDTDEV